MTQQTRISRKFSDLKQNKQKAFIPFITAGDPSLKETENLILKLEKLGASVIELGVPFSDPMADGPTIQKANERSLANGTNIEKILNLVKTVRKKSQVPLLLMGYYNPIFQYGLKNFCQDAEKSGVDGLLIVDLPAEEASPLRQELKGKAIDLIYLLTPTSTNERIQLVKKYGSGFVYYVSMTGITGSQNLKTKDVAKAVRHIKKSIKLPLNVGFGISKPEHVKVISKVADGVVVGSSLIKKLEENHGKNSPAFERYVTSLIRALE